MASRTTEDGFHEIQLNGKQLVFLFMAATVVSVVIFLCGVLVGRGVRAERVVVQSAALSEAPSPDILPSATPSAAPPIQAGADPRNAAPPATVGDASESAASDKSTSLSDDIKPDVVKAAEAARAAREAASQTAKPEATEKVEKPQKQEKPQKAAEKTDKPVAPVRPSSESVAAVASPAAKETAASPAATAATAGSGSGGYAVQVAAVNVRSDADAIAKRFSSKGYSAYVETPPNGTGTVFRVRIGTFPTRREAETIAAKLQKEEQIKPWVTR